MGFKTTYHDSGEVHAGDSIHDDEYPRIRQVVKAVVKTNWSEMKKVNQYKLHTEWRFKLKSKSINPTSQTSIQMQLAWCG